MKQLAMHDFWTLYFQGGREITARIRPIGSLQKHVLVVDSMCFDLVYYSKIPWYPKVLFQRENALASF
jgi:hypothetical protein